MSILFVLVGIGIIFGCLAYYLKKAMAAGAVRKSKFIQVKSEYEGLLNKLEHDPDSNRIRVQVLDIGRKYYGYLHPDLVNFVDNVPVDNGSDSTVIETKVQSDLQARIGKGKVS